MMRWFHELRNPSLKCERVGHRPVEQARHGYGYPCRVGSGWLGGVADSISEKRTACCRCGAEIEPWHETEWGVLSGLSMSADRWHQLKRDGRLFQ